MIKTHLPVFLALAIGCAQAATLGAENCRVHIPEQAEMANETVEWKGPCVNGNAEGSGILLRYLKDKQVASFEGRMERGMMAEGYEKLPDSEQYEGQYKNGLRDGKGIWISDNGTRYDGEWHAGQRSGRGTITFSLGGSYQGQWIDDKPSGLGTVSYAGGKRTETGVAFPEMAPAADADLPVKKFRLAKSASDGHSLDRFANSALTSKFVPFDKNFAEMTVEQQTHIRRIYPLLHADDTPPYPEKGTSQIYRWLRTAQSEVLADGKLRIIVDVDASGKTTAVTVFESPEAPMTELIKVIFFHQKFVPARCGGQPCAMRFPFNVDFTTSYSRFH